MENQEMQMIQGMFESLVEKMDKRFESIDKRFESIDKRFESIDKRFESMDKRFDRLEQDVTEIKVTLENTTNKNIQLLVEGQQDLVRQVEVLKPLPEMVEELTAKVDVMALATHKNTNDISAINETNHIKIRR